MLRARSRASALKPASMTWSWLTWSMVSSFFFLISIRSSRSFGSCRGLAASWIELGGGLLNLLARSALLCAEVLV